MATQTPLANDDNLSPGITYTFTFELENWFSMPSVSTVLADITSQMADFISSPSASWSSGIGPLTNYLNVTFTYSGDGSDVVSDVANEFLAAFQTGSNDSYSYVQAVSGGGGITALTSVNNAVSSVATTAGSAVGTAVGAAAQGAASGIASNLGASGFILIALAIVALLAYFSSATGVRLNNA
jgi:hypothetical protein